METDSFFWQLLKQLPDTLFALLGLPTDAAAAYRFDAIEIKKSYRLDGLFVPATTNLPVYFVEVQFQRKRHFYANLFAKVFSHLDANDPNQDWRAAALFADRSVEPKHQIAYQDLLASPRVRRIYLDELSVPDSAAPGLKLLQLMNAAKSETPDLVAKLMQEARQESDCERSGFIIELTEELLMRRFTQMDREEVRRMFKLDDLRKSKVWQEAEEGGIEIGEERGMMRLRKELVLRWRAKGKTLKEIAELLEIPLPEVRRLSRS